MLYRHIVGYDAGVSSATTSMAVCRRPRVRLRAKIICRYVARVKDKDDKKDKKDKKDKEKEKEKETYCLALLQFPGSRASDRTVFRKCGLGNGGKTVKTLCGGRQLTKQLSENLPKT